MDDNDSHNNFLQNFSEEFLPNIQTPFKEVEKPRVDTPSPNKSPKVIKSKQKLINKSAASSKANKKGDNQKSPKPSKKGRPKRIKDLEHEAINGRPNNQISEVQHLKENKSYNDIIYHYSRFLILLKIKQGNARNHHALQLSNQQISKQQSQWISQAKEIMSINNFPSFEEKKPVFLLHPNSPHFIIQYRKLHERKSYYSSEEMKFIFLSFLQKKRMLTSNIYNYVCEYWQDIVYLTNNPNGQQMPNQHPHDEEISGEPEDMLSPSEGKEVENNENINENGRKNQKKANSSEIELIRAQFAKDQTCIAYEIACYFHACYEKFDIRIRD